MQKRKRQIFPSVLAGVLALTFLVSSGCAKRKKYDNPITKDTLQPDKVLFDRAIKDVEHGRFEVARLTLNTLINTYDTSEFLAKAKLAIADSWYREGGAHGLAQAEAEYKDFILFYPNMEESAESQMKICGIHSRQMEKADRDPAQAQRTEDECRDLLNKFPNSKFVPQAAQMLRNAQEVLADKEFRTGAFYRNKGSYPAAANRLAYVTQQYPLYSGTDEALWQLADSYNRMGDRFEGQAADAYTKIVRDYPLSAHVDDATAKLEAMKRPVPKADPAAVARMKFELENRSKQGLMARSMGVISGKPDTHLAAKLGDPSMKTMRPPIPVSVPASAASTDATGAAGGGVSDVVANTVTDTTQLDRAQDARTGRAGAAAGAPAAGTAADGTPAAGAAPGGAAAPGAQNPAALTAVSPGTLTATPAATPDNPTAAAQQPLPTNHSFPVKKQKKPKAKKAEKPAAAAPAAAQPEASNKQ